MKRTSNSFLRNFYNKEFQGMEEIPDESIDLVFTSPPYKFKDGFRYEMMEDLRDDLLRVMKPNALFFLNFGHLAHHKHVPLKVAVMMSEHFNFVDTIIWEKPQYSPSKGDKRLNNKSEFIFKFKNVHEYGIEVDIDDEFDFEFIFQFANGNDYHLDRLAIGVPYEDKSNVGRYSDIDLHCRGNVWKVGYKTIQNSMQKPHPHRFPVELPELGIKLSGIKERSNVLDPFTGSGSTILACNMRGMNFYGYEKDPYWYQRAVERFGGR